jgi:hypothetical protein
MSTTPSSSVLSPSGPRSSTSMVSHSHSPPSEWLVSLRLLFSIKNAALACLVLQNTFLVVYMRYSRTVKGTLGALCLVLCECVHHISHMALII